MQPINKNLGFLLFLIFIINSLAISAQIGGKDAYTFLLLPPSARVTSLGGSLIGVQDNDVNLALSNPATLTIKGHNQLSFSHNFHFSGINNGYVSYARHSKKSDITFHGGVQYITYGDFIESDLLGNQLGTFKANETSFVLGASKKVAERITLGINTKAIFSNLESYSSTGLGIDLGLLYGHDSLSYTIAIVIKNLGSELSTYNGIRFGMPLDIQVGITKKLKYLPFRFSIIAHQLHRSNIRYDDPNRIENTDVFGNPIESSGLTKSIDNIFRHLIFSGEFLLGKTQNLNLRLAYNHLRRQELSVTNSRSLAGFSAGFGIKIKAFKFDYGLGYHHIAGAANHISVITNLNSFSSKI